MLNIASKCCVGLSVTKQHLCLGKENGGGFSAGYVLLSFQYLTLPSSQPKADCSVRKQDHTYSGQIGEKSSIKRRLVGDRPNKEGRDETEHPKPRISPEIVPSYATLPIEWSKESVIRMWTFDHRWYWTPRSGCRQGTEIWEAIL